MAHEWQRTQSRQPDIRRRLRAREGGAQHAIKTLLEALRLRTMNLRGRTALLVGYTDLPEGSPEAEAAAHVIETIRSMGAEVRLFKTDGESGAEQRVDMMRSLQGADVVLIDTDSPYVRTLRPKEMRTLGAEIIVATTLAA